jgi:hypothetical protein
MTVNVNFEIEHHDNVLKVPNAALRWKPRPQQIAPDIRAEALAAMNRRGDKSKKGADADQTGEESNQGDKASDGKTSGKDDKAGRAASPGAAKSAQPASPAVSGTTAAGTKPEDWKARTEANAQHQGKPADAAATTKKDAAQTKKPAEHGPPGMPVSAKDLAAKKDHFDTGFIWTVDGNFVRPIKVKIIATDGTMTEIREVRGTTLQEDTDIVTGENVAVEGDDTTNPFMPKLFRGGGGGGAKPK